MAAPQKGIPRPRTTDVDLDLRAAILDALRQLQGTGTLTELAHELGISVKTLSRYRSSASRKPPSLGGDLLFRIFKLCDERDVSIECHGRILRLPRTRSSAEAAACAPELRFRLTGTVEIDVASGTGVVQMESMTLELEPEADYGIRTKNS